MVDKAFSQTELIGKMKDTPPIHPAHQMRRAFYFNEWDYRQRLIHDRMWSTYLTRDRIISINFKTLNLPITVYGHPIFQELQNTILHILDLFTTF